MKQTVTAHIDSFEKIKMCSRGQKRLMMWKDRTHSYIDLIWNVRNYCGRNDMYTHLREFLGSSPHVSYMSVGKMKKTIHWAVEILNEGRELDKKYGKHEWDLIPIPVF